MSRSEYVNIIKVNPTAETPYQDNDKDVTFNITLIARTSERIDDTVNEICSFDTGVIISPIGKVYAMLYASPDLLQKGYSLMSPLILEPSDDEPVKVPLYKFKEGPDLELPCTGVKLVFLPTASCPHILVPQVKVVASVAPPPKQQYYDEPQQQNKGKTTKKTARNHMS